MPTVPTLRISSNETIKGGFNWRTGLRRFKESLGQCERAISGAGYGGVDVVVLGDSIPRGHGLAQSAYESLSHELKIKLQKEYNPIGIVGGYGLVRADYDPGFTQDSTPFTVSSGTAMIGDARGSNSAMRMRFWFNGAATDAAIRRLGVSALEPLYVKAASTGTLQWDIHQSDAFVTPGTGATAKNTISTVAGSQTWGAHHGSIPVDSTSGVAPTLNSSQNYCLQFSPSSGQIYVHGVVAYNGDIDCGIRLHQICVNGGTLTASYSGDSNARQAIAMFGANGFGASKMKLLICDFIVNEATNDPTLANLATFMSNLQSAVSTITILSSSPCWLHVIPPCPQGVSTTVYGAYAKAIYEVASANPNTMAVFDTMSMLDNVAYTTWNTRLNWMQNDAVHPNGTGAAALANILFEALKAA